MCVVMKQREASLFRVHKNSLSLQAFKEAMTIKTKQQKPNNRDRSQAGYGNASKLRRRIICPY